MCRAYAELSTCRSIGLGVGPIPITAMWQWCDRHNVEAEVAEHVISVLRLVDQETLRRQAAEARARKKD